MTEWYKQSLFQGMCVIIYNTTLLSNIVRYLYFLSFYILIFTFMPTYLKKSVNLCVSTLQYFNFHLYKKSSECLISNQK